MIECNSRHSLIPPLERVSTPVLCGFSKQTNDGVEERAMLEGVIAAITVPLCCGGESEMRLIRCRQIYVME